MQAGAEENGVMIVVVLVMMMMLVVMILVMVKFLLVIMVLPSLTTSTAKGVRINLLSVVSSRKKRQLSVGCQQDRGGPARGGPARGGPAGAWCTQLC